MGFWARLLGREVDDTVAQHQAKVAEAQRIAADGPLSLVVEEVFAITGRGTVAIAQVESGRVSVGDVLTWTALDGAVHTAAVSALEAFRAHITSAGPGERVGVLFADLPKQHLARGIELTRS